MAMAKPMMNVVRGVTEMVFKWFNDPDADAAALPKPVAHMDSEEDLFPYDLNSPDPYREYFIQHCNQAPRNTKTIGDDIVDPRVNCSDTFSLNPVAVSHYPKSIFFSALEEDQFEGDTITLYSGIEIVEIWRYTSSERTEAHLLRYPEQQKVVIEQQQEDEYEGDTITLASGMEIVEIDAAAEAEAFDGIWIGRSDSQPRCVIKDATITWHWGEESELEICASDSAYTVFQGEILRASLTPANELVWTDGDTWVRVKTDGASAAEVLLEEKSWLHDFNEQIEDLESMLGKMVRDSLR